MMIDWASMLWGFGAGLAVSLVYFAGLAASVRFALGASRPVAVLLPSAAVRIALLLGVGWLVTAGATQVWAFVGYGAAFFMVRYLATLLARIPHPEKV
ncbi:N-ATPase, AtpR subunit [Marinobacter sp. es.042]|uniref:N-ATPase subunit AtpR n=1 Tax=Marinobacter sp. es.042 TaxID=1761794 RepID=UPI000B50FEC1|nr:ATP synthase subunit I [Marinobacter sp. es.042]SNB58344.1 N-ATPase, AtpR subunit [Marinobacter sp. es.042]